MENEMKFLSRRLLHPALALLPLCLSEPSFAQEHKSHVHGTSTLLVAVETVQVVVELTAPANDIVGFEHAPNDAVQERQVDAALAVLKSPARMFALPVAAGCAVEAVHVLASIQKAGDDDDHQQPHDHAHKPKTSGKTSSDHGDEGETHGEFRLRYHFHCRAMGNLDGFELLMFAHFPRIREVQAQVLSTRGQKSITLDHDKRRLTF